MCKQDAFYCAVFCAQVVRKRLALHALNSSVKMQNKFPPNNHINIIITFFNLFHIISLKCGLSLQIMVFVCINKCPTGCNNMRLYFILLQYHSTRFGCRPHPSSGAHETVVTATGTSHMVVQLPHSNVAIGHVGVR